MREILFRGFHEDKNGKETIYIDGREIKGEWEYGVPVFSGLNNELAFMQQMYSYNCQVIPETVGQFTGLTDKNGKKIFEGDILKFDDEVWESYYTSCGYEYNSSEVENCGVVGFDEDRVCFDFIKYKFSENSVEADLHENHNIEFADFISELVVIGNIHNNPELLRSDCE